MGNIDRTIDMVDVMDHVIGCVPNTASEIAYVVTVDTRSGLIGTTSTVEVEIQEDKKS
jgi:hypothetical protein